MLLKLDIPTNIDNTIIDMIKTDTDIDLQQEKEYINNLEEWQKKLIYSYLQYFGEYEESKNCLEYHEFYWFENCNTLEELNDEIFGIGQELDLEEKIVEIDGDTYIIWQ